jgi:hypothetical protein
MRRCRAGRAYLKKGGELLAIAIAGHRVVATTAQPGSAAALSGCHIGFLLCSDACAGALQRAAAGEQQRLIGH